MAAAQAIPFSESERGTLAHIYGLAVGLFVLCLVVADNRAFITLLYASFGFVATMFAVDLALSNGRMAFPWLLRTYAVFAVYALVSIIWSRQPDIAVTRGTTIASTALALPMLAHLLRYPLVLSYALAGLAVALCLVAGLLLGAIPYPGEIWSEGGRFQGTFTLATNMARALFLVGLVAFLVYVSSTSGRLRALAAVALVLTFLLTVATFSRAGMAAIGVLMVGLLLLAGGRVALAIVASGAALIGVVFWLEADLLAALGSGALERALPLLTLDIDVGSSADLRREAITEAFVMFEQNPIFGSGLASFESFHGYYAHNAWADIAANLGVIGLGVWALIYALLLRAVRGCRATTLRRAGYVAVLAVFLLELADAFYLSRTGMLAMLLLYVAMRQAASRDIASVP
jgi:O-antigen ligase